MQKYNKVENFIIVINVFGIEGMHTNTIVNSGPNNGSRKRKANDAEFEGGGDSDSHILWHINWTRMERFFRDELILNAVGEE